MIAAGLATMVFGFKSMGDAKPPLDKFAPALIPVGLIIALLGILLTTVPNFF